MDSGGVRVSAVDFTYLRAAKVYEALADHADRPSKRTVARWCETGRAPLWAAEVIRDRLLGADTETPPPWWEAATAALVDQIEERMRTSGELDPAQVQRIAAALAGQLGLEPQPGGEVPPLGNGVIRDAGHTATKRQP